ncbi:MAG: sensor histidine kinase [Burkholderiales bacterium]
MRPEEVPPRAPLLRRQLLAWLLVPLTLLLAADTFLSYWVATRFAQRAYDHALVEIARETSLHLRPGDVGTSLDMSAEARRVLFTDPLDAIHFEVADAGGRHLAGESIPRAPPSTASGPANERFYDGSVRGTPVRIVELRVDAQRGSARPAAIVRIAETEVKRHALAREILASVVIPQVLLIALAALVVWLGVVRGLRPLERLQHSVASRSQLDRSPVPQGGVPAEVGPLVHAINALLARLDAALTLQSRFVADAAHQLKTPIAALRAQFELALREEGPAAMRRALREAQHGIDRLERLSSQLLSLARNEPEAAGSIVLVAVDLNALALEAASAWVPEAIRRGVDLGFEGAAAPVMVRGDPVRLRELFDNLLDNAVRYSPTGGRVTLRVHAAPVAVEIGDDGPGIPPEERERVFERFHRLLGSSSDGSGLGLAIAREIARVHGATIALAEDVDGIGNAFTVSFP